MTSSFDPIEVAIEEIRRGSMVIVVDDEDRENEGDLILAAQTVTAEAVNFMARYARGLICLPMTGERLDQLDIPAMVRANSDRHSTAFTVSIDAQHGTTTGISAADRARTIRAALDPETQPKDLRRPGHIFPLRAQEGGVLRRAGHTEAGVDLARLSGLYPAAVICEIMNDDGTMARTPDLMVFAREHDLKIITIQDLISYRKQTETLVEAVAESELPTEFGHLKAQVFRSTLDDACHVALVKGTIRAEDPILVRVHSECFTGDVLGSQRCDCGPQLHAALRAVSQAESGVVLYLRQEGRGIGLVNKFRAYALQDQGMDTVEANHKLGFKADLREYGIGAQILHSIGVRKIRLMTNNPRKIIGLQGYGLTMVERVTLIVESNPNNVKYLNTKRARLGHLLDTPTDPGKKSAPLDRIEGDVSLSGRTDRAKEPAKILGGGPV